MIATLPTPSELDFVVEYDGNVLPLEVKSGKDYERHNALSNVMANVEYGILSAFVFSQENVKVKGNIIYYPIYMITFLERPQTSDNLYRLDLSGIGGFSR